MPVTVESGITGPFIPNGVTTAFAFTFKADSAAEVAVVDEDGVALSSTLYSVALNSEEGGTVTFSDAPELADYAELYIVSDPAMTQESDFDNAGPSFNPASVTRAFDRAAIRDLALKAEVDRALKLPFGATSAVLPAERAGLYLSFDANSTPVASAGTGADAGLRTDLAATAGAALVAHQRAETGSVSRTIAQIINDAPLTLEQFGGGPGESTATNDAAWVLLRNQLALAAEGHVLFSEGDYQFSDDLMLATPVTGLIISGQGKQRTRLIQTDPAKDVLRVPSGAVGNTLHIADLDLVGPGYASGTTRGFYSPADTTDFPQLSMERVGISECGGDGVRIENGFNMKFEGVDVDQIGGHGMYLFGNSTVLENCYWRRIRGAGKAGVRVPQGPITLIGCNGLVLGDIWIDAGRSTLDGDAEDTYTFVNLIGCNLEDFASIGVRVRNGGLSFDFATTFIGPNTTGVAKAVLIRTGNAAGFCGNSAAFVSNGTGTYADGYPVHVADGGFPFSLVAGYPNSANDRLTFWDDTAGATRTMATIKQALVAASRYGVALYDLAVSGLFSVGQVVSDVDLLTGKVVKVGGTQVVGARGAAVADAAGGATVDTEARAALNALLARLRAHGLIAP